MAKNRIILVVIACFSVAVLAAPTPSFMPPKFPPRKPGMTKEEYSKEIEKAIEETMRQERKRSHEYINLMVREAWKRLLRVSEWQWKIIKTKVDKVNILGWRMSLRKFGSTDSAGSFHWKRPSRERGGGWPLPKTPDELTEGEKILEELIDVLEDENSKDEEIRKKMDALQQFREKARKELPKAKQELAAVLTNPRQEAVLLLTGYID